MNTYTIIPNDKIIKKTAEALHSNGFTVHIVENGRQAKDKIFEILPLGAEVMNMTSVTLETIGALEELGKSQKYRLVKNILETMDSKTQALEKKRLGSSHEWAIGSVHAITMDGKVLVASNTGSQLGAYAYGAINVLWVVGAQKIVKNFDEGMTRLYEHSLPLESERAKKAYGVPGSFISKILVVNRETVKNRIHIILVKEILGF